MVLPDPEYHSLRPSLYSKRYYIAIGVLLRYLEPRWHRALEGFSS